MEDLGRKQLTPGMCLQAELKPQFTHNNDVQEAHVLDEGAQQKRRETTFLL